MSISHWIDRLLDMGLSVDAECWQRHMVDTDWYESPIDSWYGSGVMSSFRGDGNGAGDYFGMGCGPMAEMADYSANCLRNGEGYGYGRSYGLSGGGGVVASQLCDSSELYTVLESGIMNKKKGG